MRVLHSKPKKIFTKLVLLTLGITSLGVVIAGAVTGNPFLIGGGLAGLFLLGAASLSTRKTNESHLV